MSDYGDGRGGRRSELPIKMVGEKNRYALIVERLREIMHGAGRERGGGLLYCTGGEWRWGQNQKLSDKARVGATLALAR